MLDFELFDLKSKGLLEHLIITLKLIQKRPALYFSNYPNYDTSSAFIEGYLFAFSRQYQQEFASVYGQSLWTDLHDWYTGDHIWKQDREFSYIFKNKFNHLDDEALIQKYLDTMIGFFENKMSES